MTGEHPALALRGLAKRFDGKVAVAGVDLDVPAGSFYGLLGPNGAGKTTTLSMAVGLLRPDARSGAGARPRRLGRPGRGQAAARRDARRRAAVRPAQRGGAAGVPRAVARDGPGGGRPAGGGAAGRARARRRRPDPGGGLLGRHEEEDRAGLRAAARAAAAGARRAVRGGRPGLGGADPRHPAPLRRRRRHGGLLQPRDGGRGAALHARGDPGRRAASSGSAPSTRCAATGRWRTSSSRWSAGGRRPARSCRGCPGEHVARERGRARSRPALRPAQAAGDGERLPRPGLAGRAVRRAACWRALVRRHRVLPAARRAGAADDPAYALWSPALGGGLLVLGWLLLPLVFFGVDETLDPARFALLPLPRRTLVDRPARRRAGRRAGDGDAAGRRRAGGRRRVAGRLVGGRWSRRSAWSPGCCSAWPPAAR